jgi:hypothetical protein
MSARNKMKSKKYHTIGTVSNVKIAEKGNIDTHNTQAHDSSLSCPVEKRWRGQTSYLGNNQLKNIILNQVFHFL